MVSEFNYSEAPKTESQNVTFRIWARKEALDQVELAKETGPKILSYFSKYFSTEYPLPKQDMAAIPDFNAGAMENWGLITYRLEKNKCHRRPTYCTIKQAAQRRFEDFLFEGYKQLIGKFFTE